MDQSIKSHSGDHEVGQSTELVPGNSLSPEDLSQTPLADKNQFRQSSETAQTIINQFKSEQALNPGARLVLAGMNLSGLNFEGTDYYSGWHGPDMSSADCSGTNFRGANLYTASLAGADCRGADFTGTNLIDAYVLGIKVDATTRGLNRFATACAEYTTIACHAESCGSSPESLLLAFGGFPEKDVRRPFELSEKARKVFFRLDNDLYAESMSRALKNGSIVVTENQTDTFDHFGSESRRKQFNYQMCDITLDTPENQLLNPVRQRFFGGYGYHAEDVPGECLMESNTRHLSTAGRSVISAFAQDSARVLELGAGAGVAAGELSQLPQVSSVDTAALSPTSPNYRLNKTWEEIFRDVGQAFNHKERDWSYWQKTLELRGADEATMAGIRRLYVCTRDDGVEHLLNPPFHLKTQLAFALHSIFPELEIFTRSKDAYIEKQYIGRYPAHAPTPPGRYQIIHDDNGPLWHQSRISVVDEGPTASIGNLLRLALPSLAEDGCIVCSRIEMNESNRQSLRELFETSPSLPRSERAWRQELAGRNLDLGATESVRLLSHSPNPGDMVLVGSGDRPVLIFAKEGSPVATLVRERLSLSYGEGGIINVEDPLKLLS